MSKYAKLTVGLIVVLVVAGGSVVLLTHKKSTKSVASGASNATQSVSKVTMKNTLFTPKDITVKVGTKVTWTNSDSMDHTVTANELSTDAPSSSTLKKGDTYSFTFKKAGTYQYHCVFHPAMQGTVTVTN